MRPTILFRFDATSTIGYGHAIRCFSLSEEFSARGYKPHFAAKPETHQLLVKMGVQPDHIHAVESETGSSGDATETAAIAARVNTRWIVIDGYGLSGRFQRALRALSGCYLLVLDDEVIDSFDANIILNQNLGAESRSRYESQKETKLLLGAPYTLFRRDFHHEKPRTPRVKADKVTLMFGGADTPNITASMLAALSRSRALDDRYVRVIIGDAYQHRDSLQAIQVSNLCKCEIVSYTPAIVEHYRWSDVVVSAAGSAAWELALLGIPMALVSSADNQIPVAESLAERGAAIYLGDIKDFDWEKAAQKVIQLLNELELRRKLHSNCRELFDCRGAQRVVDEIEKYTQEGACYEPTRY